MKRLLKYRLPLAVTSTAYGMLGAALIQLAFIAVPILSAQDPPHLSDLWVHRRLMVGPVNDLSNSNRMIEGLFKDDDEPVEVHVEGGGSTGYVGFGGRNDRGVDGSNVTLAGITSQVYGSAATQVIAGRTMADMALVGAAGTSSRGLGLGSGQVGPVFMFTATAAGGQEPRIWIQDAYKVITDNVATAFVRIDVPANTLAGGKIDWTVWAVDATARQARTGTLWYTSANASDAENCVVGNVAGTDLISIVSVTTGTITASFTCQNTPTNGFNISVTSDTSLTPTAMGFNYSVYKNLGQGAINPL